MRYVCFAAFDRDDGAFGFARENHHAVDVAAEPCLPILLPFSHRKLSLLSAGEATTETGDEGFVNLDIVPDDIFGLELLGEAAVVFGHRSPQLVVV